MTGVQPAVDEIAAAETGELGAPAYRPHLDGLRAIAVYLVVLFHAGSDRFSGGYVGVDVFFVLSGYLVTQLLLRDIDTRGSITYGRFYSRRFRRLLPAAFVVLIVTALVYSAVASPAEVLNAAGSFKAAFLYVANWYFVHQSTGYFGTDITANPVLHFWSLAVEEQFYLVWPLTLGGVFWLTGRFDPRRRRNAIRVVVALGMASSAVWALSLATRNPNRAYYGTDARAYQLLAGALLALTPAVFAGAERYRRRLRIASAASVLAILFLASSSVDFNAIDRGIAVTIATCVLIVALEAGGGVAKLLSTRTAVYLGKISYGTYLWHWIVILVLVQTVHPSSLATIALACLIASALASLSFEIMEHPVRISKALDRHRWFVIATGLTVSLVSALVLIPKIVKPANAAAPTLQLATTGLAPVPPGIDWHHADRGQRTFVACDERDASKCTIVHGHGPHILVIGDSHAQMFVPAFIRIARRDGLTLSVSTRGICPWERGSAGPGGAFVGRPDLTPAGCTAHQNDLYDRVIPALDPDVIVVADMGYGDILRSAARSVRQLTATGASVFIIEPTPRTPFDPVNCISKARWLEECRSVAPTTPSPIEVGYRNIARQNKGVTSVDFDRLICPFLPICDPVVNNQLVKWEAAHITLKFAQTLAPQIDVYLKQTGAISH